MRVVYAWSPKTNQYEQRHSFNPSHNTHQWNCIPQFKGHADTESCVFQGVHNNPPPNHWKKEDSCDRLFVCNHGKGKGMEPFHQRMQKGAIVDIHELDKRESVFWRTKCSNKRSCEQSSEWSRSRNSEWSCERKRRKRSCERSDERSNGRNRSICEECSTDITPKWWWKISWCGWTRNWHWNQRWKR